MGRYIKRRVKKKRLMKGLDGEQKEQLETHPVRGGQFFKAKIKTQFKKIICTVQ